ncbi:MAG: cytochrome c [Verrucomicrobia bacterium]|nr:cytochrome c [Verrucomicrobiota bacterium]
MRTLNKSILIGAALLGAALVTGRAEDAKALYEKDCAKCHGTDGKGDTKMGKKLGAKNYADPSVQQKMTDAAAIKAIKEGLKDKADKTLMKPSPDLTDDQVKALVAYMRTFQKK